jgi:hypothetical protein
MHLFNTKSIEIFVKIIKHSRIIGYLGVGVFTQGLFGRHKYFSPNV